MLPILTSISIKPCLRHGGTNQGLEHPDGSPIEVNADIRGLTRNATYPTVGPFEDLKPGLNSYKILLNIPDSATGATAIYNLEQKYSTHKRTSRPDNLRYPSPTFQTGAGVGKVNVNGQMLPIIQTLER